MKKEFEKRFLTKGYNFKKDTNPYEVFNFFDEKINNLEEELDNISFSL